MVDGTTKYKATKFLPGQEAEARAYARSLEAATPGTFKIWADEWLKRRREDGIRDVDNDVARLRDWVNRVIGHMKIDEVRPAHVLQIVNGLKDAGKAPRRNLPRSIRNFRLAVPLANIGSAVRCRRASLTRSLNEGPALQHDPLHPEEGRDRDGELDVHRQHAARDVHEDSVEKDVQVVLGIPGRTEANDGALLEWNEPAYRSWEIQVHGLVPPDDPLTGGLREGDHA